MNEFEAFEIDGGLEDTKFTIEDDSGADWAIRKILDAQDEAQKWADFFAGQAEHERAKAQKSIDFFTNLLIEYFDKVPHKSTKTGIEKYALPSGELVLKPATIEYVRDDEKLVEWCKNNYPDFVKTKETPSWTDIKKLIVSTGDIPDGVMPVEKQPSFSVKLGAK